MADSVKLWDKVFYTGQAREYLYQLWTVTAVDADYIALESDETRWETTRVDLLDVAYSGAPKYVFNEKVYYFFDNVYVAGLIQVVIPSLSNKPNQYEVLFENGEDLTLEEPNLFQFDPTKLLDSTRTTQDHVQKVRDNISRFVSDMIRRGEVHDMSKYEDPEKVLLDAIEYQNVNNGYAPFGSPQYIQNTQILKPMLKHHYSINSHHPQHYPNGVMDMSLMDIVEMFCDWQAAALRNKEPEMNISHAATMHGLDPQLERIFKNTARAMGFKFK
jgi:hypothetical protein